jgi:molybdopterin-guanine dinucleotide biosynthesis adapter protein
MKVFGFAGYSGSGKTTLIEQLIPRFVLEGLKVSLIKHAHHDFDIDRPGKDSYRHREAGATEVMITGGHRWVLLHELRGAPEPDLKQQLARLAPCDLVLVEGFKFHPIPKLEVYRRETGKPLLFPDDRFVVAVASDSRLETALPQFQIDDADAIAEFILDYCSLNENRVEGAGRLAV